MQSLASKKIPDYASQNPLMMVQPEQENFLSLYARTQDGEWQIPTHVDPDDPWLRLLVLSTPRPVLIDLAIEINGKPFRSLREAWIDQLQAQAKAIFLVRTGAATAEATGVTEVDAKEEEVEAKEVGAKETETAEKKAPMLAAQPRKTQTASQQLINYLAANQTTADREEVRWLMAQRTGGPALLTLGSAMAWRRANVAPLWNTLDQDNDQILSDDEIAQSSAIFKQADTNQDDNLDLNELQRMSKHHAHMQQTKSHPLLLVVDAQTDWQSLKKHLQKAYPEQSMVYTKLTLLNRIQHGDRSLQASDLIDLATMAPDLTCCVNFDDKTPSLTLLSTGTTTAESWKLTSATDQVLTVEQDSVYLELTAAQNNDPSGTALNKTEKTQVAIGAVVDGYPLFRLLDTDNNRQLTLREQRRAVPLLTTLDRNADGQLNPHEIPTAIRLAVTRGPHVHQHLSKATAAQRKISAPKTSPAPAWFTSMDTNHDGDLSRREFQGSPAQFKKFDNDNDGLISHNEAQ